MATTSIWKVEGWLGKVLGYVMNPEKTEVLAEEYETQGIGEALLYATNSNKTEQQLYVTGINCLPVISLAEMTATKRQYNKLGGIVAFHGYQSFAPGEATPAIAHEIGIALASELWEARFEVVVSTHLDKGHLHNHFVINSVSFADGKRFRRDNKCYRAMRETSDRLCREHKLSVIENPAPGRAKHYGEWRAEREGTQTWRGLIKADVDESLARAMTDKQFFGNLRALGYDIKMGKDISVRPSGKERFVRLARNFGDDYTYESIKARILANKQPRLAIGKPKRTPQPSTTKSVSLPKGTLVDLYRHYKYLFDGYGKGNSSTKRMHFLLREDLRHFGMLTQELDLLVRENISTTSELESYTASLAQSIHDLINDRKTLRAQARKENIGTDAANNPRIAEINERLKTLRKETRLCKSIAERSRLLPDRIVRIEGADERASKKEVEQKHGRDRSSGRTNR